MTLNGRAKPHLKVMQSNFKLLMNRFNYGVLFIPPALTVLLWIIMAAGVVNPAKPPLEIAAVVVCGLFMLIAVVRFIVSRHVFFLWSTALFLLILSREIHFEGSDEAIFIGLVILLGIVLLKYDRFKAYLDNPWVVNLLVTGFFTYFLSQTVDQRWWRGFPGEEIVFVSLEETLELAGHCMIGFAGAFCRVIGPAV
ncbi:MAG: hypothetical protein IMF02_08240 [Proteobacteria bacterium]|nr:hypothetical protein [Pseudomonadota bacterium]